MHFCVILKWVLFVILKWVLFVPRLLLNSTVSVPIVNAVLTRCNERIMSGSMLLLMLLSLNSAKTVKEGKINAESCVQSKL